MFNEYSSEEARLLRQELCPVFRVRIEHQVERDERVDLLPTVVTRDDPAVLVDGHVLMLATSVERPMRLALDAVFAEIDYFSHGGPRSIL